MIIKTCANCKNNIEKIPLVCYYCKENSNWSYENKETRIMFNNGSVIKCVRSDDVIRGNRSNFIYPVD